MYNNEQLGDLVRRRGSIRDIYILFQIKDCSDSIRSVDHTFLMASSEYKLSKSCLYIIEISPSGNPDHVFINPSLDGLVVGVPKGLCRPA